ncbi:hypothetical protein H7I77_15215 [Mycolicibacterium novocastrense]|uniref:Transcriptional regulator n=1 Tax=Mycolicibacterium novocastrense TaxID=59813 RepID=A0AAW5SNR3_MYCNV|nr:hypothetical protein [Mycolicibacterium novocastrense]MCV7024682.1 hypothetical protein [Mycolicibacterium novocastrense]GAT11315.1 uncharacterized protein RMCN_4448 [Mycolicibacterium novocastrense]
MTVKDDLLADFPQVYPGLTRSEVEQLLTLLDKGATAGGLGLSIATAIKPLVPDIAQRIESYKQSDVDDYVRMLRGAVVLLLQRWQPEDQPPTPDSVSAAIKAIEADA